MNLVYGKKSDIFLWCYGVIEDNRVDLQRVDTEKQKSGKRSHSPDVSEGGRPQSKRTTCAQKVTELEKVLEKLKGKDGINYSTEKLSAWAHMIHMGKHSSYELPPDLPYFAKRKSEPNPHSPDTTTM